MNNRSKKITAGWLLIAQCALIAIPFLAMGGPTGWPATTSDPGIKMLPIVQEHLAALRLGYGGYLLYSVLFLFTGVATLRALRDDLDWLGLGAASLSTLARCLGILRWLTAAPALAEAYTLADQAQRPLIAATFDALNRYGGGIGEGLGVSLFAAIWVARVAFAARENALVPKPICAATYAIAGVVAVPAIELFGIDLGPITMVTGTMFHLWLLVFGIFLLRQGRAS